MGLRRPRGSDHARDPGARRRVRRLDDLARTGPRRRDDRRSRGARLPGARAGRGTPTATCCASGTGTRRGYWWRSRSGSTRARAPASRSIRRPSAWSVRSTTNGRYAYGTRDRERPASRDTLRGAVCSVVSIHPVTDLPSLLALEKVKPDAYLGGGPVLGWGRLYGGQVVAQALRAACLTVDATASAAVVARVLRARRRRASTRALRGRTGA